ncbi:antitoxin VbhA family protein [Bacillus kexueae]|uniref:antitoxin VbhA family protein n=1 Tax=Aeribacillus kexueae TaxID=2078952 RepID=UPI001FB03ACA|nr:antitoxin VbhA family protein [Bacillus kexueae]
MSDFCEKAWAYVRSTNAIEGKYLTPEQETFLRKVMKDEITEEEFHQQALELARRK